MKWSCDKGYGNDDDNDDGGGSTNHGHYMKERSDVSKSLWNSGRHIITLAFHHHPDLIAIDMVPRAGILMVEWSNSNAWRLL